MLTDLGREQARHPHVELVRQVCQYIQARVEDSPTLDEISAAFHMSPFHLQRTFKRLMGITPKQYAERRRLDALKSLLREGESVTDAMYSAGYGSSSRLYEQAAETLGMTPATYGKGGAGMNIHYSLVPCHLGKLLIATTERGICAVHLGRNDLELETRLREEYRGATIEKHKVGMCQWVEELLEHLKGERPHLDLPLDIQANAFQSRVWQALREIPYGETRTYGEIAKAIGLPGGANAVAKAIHENPTIMLIPCHRVTREDGQPTEYYDDRERFSMQALRTNEQQHTQK